MPDLNPFQAPATDLDRERASAPVVPHTLSIRSELWRGAKYGAKIGGGIMAAASVIMAAIMVASELYSGYLSGDGGSSKFNFFLIAAVTSSTCVAIILMGIYGAITGAVVMTLATIVKKVFRKEASTSDVEPNEE